VLTRIGIDDPLRAIEMMLESERSVSRSVSLSRVVTAILDAGSASIEQLANSVLLLPNSGEAQEVVANLTTSWASENPGAALNWLMRQGTQCGGQSMQGPCAMITPQLFNVAAQHMGAQDPSLALNYADRVPPEMRTDWVRATAAGLAREDPREAAVWVGRLGNDPDYGPAAVAVVEHLARIDVQAAASLLDTVPAGAGISGAVHAVASAWAGTDPWSAASWIVSVDDERVRTPALTNIIREWSQADLRAASSWLYSYPQGRERDALINTAIGVGVNGGELDGSLLSALSTDEAREQAAANAVQTIAMNGDLLTARRWLDLHVRTRATRERLERTLDAL
jgi:hypothetical protein